MTKAAENAEEAATFPNGTLLAKLQAFRIWILAEYTKEAVRSCADAKRAVLFTLGEKIFQDEDFLRICESYYKSQPREVRDKGVSCCTINMICVLGEGSAVSLNVTTSILRETGRTTE